MVTDAERDRILKALVCAFKIQEEEKLILDEGSSQGPTELLAAKRQVRWSSVRVVRDLR